MNTTTTPIDDQPMTGAEFRLIRDRLGLTLAWLADHLGVAQRSVERWDAGKAPIGAGVADDMRQLEQDFETDVARRVAAADLAGTKVLEVPRTNDDAEVMYPDADYPHGWYLAIAREHNAYRDGIYRVAYWTPDAAAAAPQRTSVNDPGFDRSIQGAVDRHRGQ